MPRKNPRVFLDTSVLFAAVLSPGGGARKLMLLSEAGFIDLAAGPAVLAECDKVIRRKTADSLPLFARLLESARIEICTSPTRSQLKTARSLVHYLPDARVLAEALRARPDWFVTHDKVHFLKKQLDFDLPFTVGTPGDFLQAFREAFGSLTGPAAET